MSRAKGTSASAVSAALKRAGFRPVPPGREGIQVTGKNPVCVRLTFDSERMAAEARVEVERALVELGYLVDAPATSRVMRVEREHRCACGEPEDGGEFGWFDDGAGNTYCNACGGLQP